MSRPVIHGRDHALGGADPIPGLGAPVAANGLLQTYSLAGARTVANGTLRWYPVADGEIDFVHAAVGVAPTGSGLTVRVKLNGTSVGTVTIAASGFTDTFVPSTTALVVGDYLTVDVTAVGSTTPGSDLVVQFWGAYS